MVECTLSITHCLRLNLQLHTIDLVRTCRISSFCIVAWQLARFQLTRRIARSLGDSWASCYRPDAIPATQPTVSVKARLLKQYAAFLCLWYFHWLKVKVTFSALTQLVGQHPASKNWVLRCWHGYLCGVRCRLFAYGPADATALQSPSSLALFVSRLVFLFWYRLAHVVLESRPLNWCCSTKMFYWTASVKYHCY